MDAASQSGSLAQPNRTHQADLGYRELHRTQEECNISGSANAVTVHKFVLALVLSQGCMAAFSITLFATTDLHQCNRIDSH